MKNRKIKTIISDIYLKGRNVYWFGEETEIFIAESIQKLVDCYGMPDEDEPLDEQSGKLSKKSLWKAVAYEVYKGSPRGAKVRNKYGEILPYYTALPMVAGVYGDKNDVCQVSTSYN